MVNEALDLIFVTFADGTTRPYPRGTTLLEISRDYTSGGKTPVVAARVDNHLRELTYCLEQGGRVEFLDLNSEDGVKIYRRSLSFVLIRAAKELFPGCQVTIGFSLSRGLYGELAYSRSLKEDDVGAIEARMREIIDRDEPFERVIVPIETAKAIFAREGDGDKVRLLGYLQDPMVKIYRNGRFHDYFYGYMVPSTAFLKQFRLVYHRPGFILQYPDMENPKAIPPVLEQNKLTHVFQEAERWAQILQVENVASLNEQIAKGHSGELIRISEAFHEKKISHIADLITGGNGGKRVILVAGPSSSGKTTFAQRLLIQLRVNGMRPVTLSLDDYFVERHNTPIDENGRYDFEAIEAIDLPLFNEHLVRLIEGEKVEIPIYNFKTGKREYAGKQMKIDREQPIIIEGLHGLNEKLTSAVPQSQKFRIYVSALTQLNIDRHNHIPTTDNRILRRIVRDYKFRAHDVKDTISMWPSVRRGEGRNIFPYQEEADIMFNSALLYELAVLKTQADPLLRSVSDESPEYSDARRLV